MDIDDRIRAVLNSCGYTTEQVAEKTGIKYSRWTTVRKTGGRARAEEVEALCKLFPEFALWIASGNVLPDAGQVSPEIEDTRKAYNG